MAARLLVTRHPNERLQELMQEAGVSNAGLARRINLFGAEHGLDLRYDKTSVGRWIRGQQPRGQTPEIVAEALSRKLGRTVSVEEIGMGSANPGSDVGLHFASTAQEALEQVCELWRNDAAERGLVSGATRPASALVEPSRDWLISEPDPLITRNSGPRVGAADVTAVRSATRAMAELDHRFGSGHIRPVVVHYLDSVVSVLLAGFYSRTTGRQLYAAAAQLTELAGYMAVDIGRLGLAQRYYIQALRLAQAADDRAYGGYVLAAGISHLVAFLGSPPGDRPAGEGRPGRSTWACHRHLPVAVLCGRGARARAARRRSGMSTGRREGGEDAGRGEQGGGSGMDLPLRQSVSGR
ncbi:hypothetical protein GCM10020000_16430 [Streptomyces olivoverticillatus]